METMTAQLAGSPVSAFYYADKLFTPLTTTLVYSISTVLFPQFSEKFTQQDRPAYLQGTVMPSCRSHARATAATYPPTPSPWANTARNAIRARL